MAVTLTPEEQAALDELPVQADAEQTPDMGVIGGALNALGLWDAPEAMPPDAQEAELLRKQEGRQLDIAGGTKPGYRNPNGTTLGTINEVIHAPVDALGTTVGSGMMKGVFETKDFLFGDTPPAEQSDFRWNIEQDAKDASEASMLNGVAVSMGQFAAGMIGVGKFTKLMGLKGAVTKAGTVGEVGKAAMAGMIAFDPLEERLSNAIQGTFLANPVNGWLAAKEGDEVWEGRLKNAMESIGMDAVLGGTFLVAGKLLKAMKAGDNAKVQSLTDEFDATQKAHLEEEQAAFDPPATPTDIPGDVPPSAGPVVDGADVAPVDGGTGGGDVSVIPGASPEGQAPNLAAVEGQPGVTGSRPEVMAANQNPGGATSVSPTGTSPNGISVKVLGDQTPLDPSLNGFGVPKRPKANTNPSPYVKYADEDTADVFAKSVMDVEAVDGNGGFYQAMEAGHKFGDQLDTVPYHKFTTQTEIDNFIARAVDAVEEGLDDAKGGAVLSDAKVDKVVKGMVKLTGTDPGYVLGKIQQAGANAKNMAAQMEVGFTLAQKAWIDVHGLNERYRLGDHTGYGSKEAHWQDINRRMSVAASFYGAARSIMANSGRAMRRMRTDFMFDPGKFGDVDPGSMSAMISKAGANPSKLKTFVDNRGIFEMIGDTAMFLRVSGLVSGPASFGVNAISNMAALVQRPFERIVGSSILALKSSVVKGEHSVTDYLGQAGKDLRQYQAMGHGLIGSFKDAGQAFLMNESLLSPHNTEWHKLNMAPGGQALGPGFFRPLDADTPMGVINNLAFNTLSVAGAAGSVMTRGMGAVDEVVKQTAYKSYVVSRATQRAASEGAAQGLKGKDLKAYIKSEVDMAYDNAFDSMGVATDANALKEAQTTTHQQQLGDFGQKVQGLANANYITKFVVPFIKTPTNILKWGMRLTPGLNLASKEFRNELMGVHGIERQTQAAGQMGMGTMYMAIGGYLASQGLFTGGGPSDPKAKQALMETGWRPYSVPITNEDGSKSYIQLNRMDPFVIPLGIAADLTEHFEQTEWDGNDDTLSTVAKETLVGASIAASRQFVNKSYLLGASQFIDMLMDPDKKAEHFVNSGAASMVPYSSMTRQLDQGEYMKDALSLSDAMRAVTPGMGEGLATRRNWLGEPVRNNGVPGYFFLNGEGTPAAVEGQRIALRMGTGFGKPIPVVKGVDLREITLSTGENAYARLQELARKPKPYGKTLTQALDKLVTSPQYARAPDGDAGTDGTKSALISKTLQSYREAAMARLRSENPEVRDAFMTAQQKTADKFRELRGMPLKTTPDQNTVGHLLDAFGIENEEE